MSKPKLKLRKRNLHPVISMVLLIFLIIIVSEIMSLFELQVTYNTVSRTTGQLESTLVAVNSLFNYDGIKYIVSSAGRNFASFTPLTTLLLTIIGVSIIKTSGLLNVINKKYLSKLNNQTITFIIIFLGTISSLINEVGYVILIPLSAIIFLDNKRNPLVGIIAAFSSVAFGYGATIFVGSLDVSLIPFTNRAARLIDPGMYVSLTSNLFILIASSIILSLVGTFIIEKSIVPKLGKYRKGTLEETQPLEVIDFELEEQKRLESELYENIGLKRAFWTGTIIILIFIYSLLPNLPLSGLLLDMNENTYLNQIFGTKSYFQDGFTFLTTFLFTATGIAYGIGSKHYNNFSDMVKKTNENLSVIGSLILPLFVAAQLISIFKYTNIGTIILASASNFISTTNASGMSLILLVLVIIMIVGLFVPTPTAKWAILSPSVVPALMKSNITPQFAQFILRAGDSITKGITPLMPYFIIYVSYLNIYNINKESISITKSIRYLFPYFIATLFTWIAIIIIWYLIGFPIGPNVFPTA